MNKIRIGISIVMLLSGCIRTEKQIDKTSEAEISQIQKDSSLIDSNGFIRISQINARQLLPLLLIESKKENEPSIISTIGQTEPDWLNINDLEFLVSKIESPQKCKCITRVIASHIPDSKNMTIGNQAISIIEAYRNGQAFPNRLTICEFYEKEKVMEIKKWWNKYKNGS